jgi:hypothetical protein
MYLFLLCIWLALIVAFFLVQFATFLLVLRQSQTCGARTELGPYPARAKQRSNKL